MLDPVATRADGFEADFLGGRGESRDHHRLTATSPIA